MVILVLVAAMFGANVAADVTHEVRIGSRVRVTAAGTRSFEATALETTTTTEGKGKVYRPPLLVGTVISIDRDSLIIRQEGLKNTTRLMLALVDNLELSQGERHLPASGAAIGAVVGAVVGAGAGALLGLLAVGAYEMTNNELPPEQRGPPGTGEDVALFAKWGAIIGGVAGGFWGSFSYKREVWTEVDIAWRQHSPGIRLGFGAAPLRSPGMTMFARLSF